MRAPLSFMGEDGILLERTTQILHGVGKRISREREGGLSPLQWEKEKENFCGVGKVTLCDRRYHMGEGKEISSSWRELLEMRLLT